MATKKKKTSQDICKMTRSQIGREKRKTKRIKVPIDLKYKIKSDRGHFQPATFEDISGLGLGLVIAQPISKGEEIEVLVTPDDGTEPLRADCKACWCKKIGPNRFHVGLAFVEIKDRMHFIEFLSEKMAYNPSNKDKKPSL